MTIRDAFIHCRRIALLCAACLIVARAAAAEPTNHFWFVQVTDTHSGLNDHKARLERVVDEINNLPMKIEFVVHTGDFFTDNILKPGVINEATSALARIKVPLHTLPGNHDILRNKLEPTLSAYTNAIGPLCSRAEYHGVVFLFLDTEPLRKGFSVPGYDPLKWLVGQLKETAGKPVIVCHHAPAIEDFYDNEIHPGWPQPVRAEWNALLESANVKAVLTGHFHRDELYWEGRIPVYVSSSVAGFWGRQGSFRIYEYRDGRLGYRTKYLE
jgi:DNA repair exonuclease SbcCD nuclease subunit